MFAIIRRNPLAFAAALLLHLALVAFLVVGVDWREKPKPLASNAPVVQARVVDERAVRKELQSLRNKDQRRQREAEAKRRKEAKRLAALKKRREQEKRRLARLERERKARLKAAAEAKRRAAAEKARIAALKKKEAELKKRQEAERRRLAAIEAKRKAEEQARAEARRKAEEKARAEAKRKRLAAEKRRRAEAARKKREAEARARAEAAAREKELQAQFEAEQRASEAARIVRQIQDKVARKWTAPPGTLEKGLSCRIKVRLGANGSVLAVSVDKSSGNAAFDRSVVAAVWKADPLPMPDDPSLRARSEFRNHTFIFDPSKSLN
jgi:colicin import membrane protein